MNRRRQPDPDESWTGPAAPNARPPQERERFDNLMTDPYHVRGDLRMVGTTVRRRRLDYIPGGKEALSKVFFERGWINDRQTLLAHLRDNRRVWVTIRAVQTVVEMERQNLRERYYPRDRPMPDENRGRSRQRWDARDLPRIDAHNWRNDVLSRPRGRLLPYDVSIRIIGEDEEVGKETVTAQPARLVVGDRAVGGPLVLFECPRCRRPFRYLYAGPNGLTCRKGLGLVYRTQRPSA